MGRYVKMVLRGGSKQALESVVFLARILLTVQDDQGLQSVLDACLPGCGGHPGSDHSPTHSLLRAPLPALDLHTHVLVYPKSPTVGLCLMSLCG